MGSITDQATEIYIRIKGGSEPTRSDVEVLMTAIRIRDQRILSLKDDIIWLGAEIQRAME